jgi:uncharacterized protein YbcC (UPF0753/DUF2309 family)
MNSNNNLKPEKIEELHELIERSSRVIAHYWPMTGFVHHNPLHDLISHSFQDAVRISKRFTGGEGYLQNKYYREFLKSGRITAQQLDDALSAVAGDDVVEVAGQKISHFDVLKTHMLEGISSPAKDTIEATVNRAVNSSQIRGLADRVTAKVVEQDETEAIGKDMTLIKWCDNTLNKRLEWTMNREVIKWCEAFLDEGHSVWPMPNRREGFYAAWKSLAVKEWSPCGISGSRKKIAALPDSPEEAILSHLDALGIPLELREEYLSFVMTSLYGWASYINWRGSQKFELNSLEWQSYYPIDIIQYLAVRLYYERELVDQTCRVELGIPGTFDAIVSYARDNRKAGVSDEDKVARLSSAWQLSNLGKALGLSQSALEQAETAQLDKLMQWLKDFPESEHGPVWLEAYEAGYLSDMVDKLRSSALKMKNDTDEPVRPDVQANFCIDVRSEPFRRNLESSGNFETFGYGGFLDIPLRYKALGHHHVTNQNPGIVQPGNTIHEVARVDEKKKEERYHKGKGFLKTIKKMQHDMKSHVITPYVKVEALGWIFGIPLIGRTLFPAAYGRWRKRIHDVIAPPISTKMTVDRDEEIGVGFTIEDQAAHVESVIRAMGLTSNKVSRLVAMVGHKSTSDNNPYESAIDCGAVWGNSMEPNVRLFASMANKPYVRKYMAEQGIVIPEDTHFIAAEQNTTTDEAIIFDVEDIPESHKKDLAVFKKGLKQATVKTALERCKRLPGSNNNPTPEVAVKEVTRRASDWSETRPEWGLSQNAAYIIGSRKLTQDFNLESRSFLNSHDYRLDPTAAKLERIMNGPLAVGQWINGEHYFSATDPEVYGSGSKIYHNVVGRFAVMSGPQSDLRTGLAWQTVMSGGDNLYHEPMRMLVVVEAPRERILGIIERSDLLTKLFDNGWMHLVAVDDQSDEMIYRYIPKKGFESIPE